MKGVVELLGRILDETGLESVTIKMGRDGTLIVEDCALSRELVEQADEEALLDWLVGELKVEKKAEQLSFNFEQVSSGN